MNEVSTLVDLLRARASAQPDQTAYIYLEDGELEERRLTYGELDQAARRIASRLRGLCPAGERALLLFPPSLEYIKAFFGCLYAGVVGVCAYSPPITGGRRLLPRLRAIVADSQARVALTTEEMLAHAEGFFPVDARPADLLWLATDGVSQTSDGEDWKEPGIDGADLAFLMYTSGSTGTPKGVMVSHGNILHNLGAFRGFDERPLTASVSWLPLFHDLGLVFGVLHPLYHGEPAILLPPAAFVLRPVRWLKAITRYRASATFGPNFAYDLCARRIEPEERGELDLSSWNFALNGSEPVRAATLARFSAAFGPYGFRPGAFYPAFGMSEVTSCISGNAVFSPPLVYTLKSEELERHRIVEAGPDDAQVHEVVGCGAVLPGLSVAIVDPETLTLCPPDQVGEVWVEGPSVAQGYWARPEDTEEIFRACLTDSGEGPFLRTGDLGFLRQGELFITGRLKDLIIVRGVNHYPQDIELSVEQSHSALRPGCGAAFSIEGEEAENLVVAHEVEQGSAVDFDEVLGNVRQRLVEEYELDPWAIALIKSGTLPKTSSGKIQRRACREAFLAGELELVREWRAVTPSTHGSGSADEVDGADGVDGVDGTKDDLPQTGAASFQAYLVAAVSRLGGISPEEIDPAQPFARFGLTSLGLSTLITEVEARFGRPLSMKVLWKYPTIMALAHHLSAEQNLRLQSSIPDEPIARTQA